MPGVLPRFESGPPSFTVAEAITGGQLVEARAASVVGVAAAGSAKCIGVARTDAQPSSVSPTGTTVYGAPSIDVSIPPDKVAVASEGYYQLTYVAAAAFGDRLKCAALGKVTPWITATDSAALIVGVCMEPAGVSAAALGLTKITL